MCIRDSGYGVRRINVSIDTLNPKLFHELTRRGDLEKVKRGIDKALKVGLKVKINTVALKETNTFPLGSFSNKTFTFFSKPSLVSCISSFHKFWVTVDS